MCKTSAPVTMDGELQPLTNLNLEDFKCSECPQKFRFKTLLRRHFVRSHSGTHPHTCAQCGHNARNLPELRVHVLTHLGKTFQCTDCSTKFTSHRSLTRHVRSIHGKTAVPAQSSTMECTACDLRFDTAASWDKHLALHIAAKARATQSSEPSESDENSPPQVKMEGEHPDGAAVQDQASWGSHATSTLREPYGTCSESGQTSPTAFQEHALAPHNVPACDRCGEKFSTAECLERHTCIHDEHANVAHHYQPNLVDSSSGLYDLSAIHYEQPVNEFRPSANHYEPTGNHYEAPVNQYLSPADQYASPADLYVSPVNHYVSPVSNYEEPVRYYEASANQVSINHYETSSVYIELSSNHCDLSVNPFDTSTNSYNPEPSRLDPCANSVDSLGSSIELLSNAVDPASAVPFSTLGDSYTNHDNLVDPVMITAPNKSLIKSFFCDVCQGSFCSKTSLIRHKLTHSGNNNAFQCTECSISCTSTAQLGRHLRIHGLDKPYKCPECDRRFKSPNNMRKHRLIHSKQSSFYTCDKCPMKFTKASELLIHEQDHFANRPYECQECHRRFIQMSHLKRHLDKKHPFLQLTQSVDGIHEVGADSAGVQCGGSAGNGEIGVGAIVNSGDFTGGGDITRDGDVAVDDESSSSVGDFDPESSALFSCSVCHKVFSRRKTLMRHLFHHLERWQSK